MTTRAPYADHGTALGVPTLVLTRALTLLFCAPRAAGRVLRAMLLVPLQAALAFLVAAVLFLSRLALRACAAFLGTTIPLAAAGAARAARPLAALVRTSARATRDSTRRTLHSLQVATAKATIAARSGAVASVATGIPESRAEVAAPPFTLAVFHNECLATGATELDAIVTVGPRERIDGDAPHEMAVVILLDCSGSMAYPLAKLRGARRAARAAIDALPDGTWFAVVRGSETAESIYPPGEGVVAASDTTRAEARAALSGLYAEGGTAFGRWLLHARGLFALRPGAIAHAILLTDGRDEGETPSDLDAALDACVGDFQCDCRGVGTEWDVAELRTVASRLLGTVDIVANPAGLEDDFRSMAGRALARTLPGVALRVWTPASATPSLRQVSPAIADLAESARVDPQTVEFPTGAWGDESRDYHLRLRVLPRLEGEEMLAARVSVVVGGRETGHANVRAVWSDDVERTATISREVAHYAGQVELADAIQAGLEARRLGDCAIATERLGRAVHLAAKAGNASLLALLGRIVEVDDASSETVRLRPTVAPADEMTLDTRSTSTVRVAVRST